MVWKATGDWKYSFQSTLTLFQLPLLTSNVDWKNVIPSSLFSIFSSACFLLEPLFSSNRLFFPHLPTTLSLPSSRIPPRHPTPPHAAAMGGKKKSPPKHKAIATLELSRKKEYYNNLLKTESFEELKIEVIKIAVKRRDLDPLTSQVRWTLSIEQREI